MLTLLATALVSSTVVLAQGGAFTPLASQSFTYTALPYQADTGTGERGTQYGYNICNSTTQGQESRCQTSVINSIDDFCLWGPPEPNSLIGDTEGEAVAWCTKGGHGTRVIPQGTLTGVQFMRTPDYVQVTGHINQAQINIAATDDGGEMDPHGADQRGNPLGGLLFSTAWGNGYTQAVEWHNFMGGGVFCLKACDPRGPNAARFCEHIFDRIGCAYNAPAAYRDEVFESCQGENQDFPGIYTSNGVVQTYTQPAESLGPISVRPYEPRVPASSACTTYTSSLIYTDGPAGTVTRSSSTTSSRSSTSTTRATTTRATTAGSSSTSTPNSGFAGAAVSLPAVLVGFFGLALAL